MSNAKLLKMQFIRRVLLGSAMGVLTCMAAAPVPVAPVAPVAPAAPAASSATNTGSFAKDVEDKIKEKISTDASAADIIRSVIEGVKLDQQIACYSKISVAGVDRYYALKSTHQGEGEGLLPPAGYPNTIGAETIFTKATTAISKANSSSAVGTVARPTEPTKIQFPLGPLNQNFMATISVVDGANICVTRVSTSTGKQESVDKIPLHSIQKAVEEKIAAKIGEGATSAEVVKTVVNEVPLTEAIVCVTKFEDGRYFRQHTQTSLNGIVAVAEETKILDDLFSKARKALKDANLNAGDDALKTLPHAKIVRPAVPILHSFKKTDGIKELNVNTTISVIDYNNICFAQTSSEIN